MSVCRVGLFGGSFDPPTLGHLNIAEQLIEQDVVDEVIFVPSYRSYHGKSYHATPDQRLDMLGLLIDSSSYSSVLYHSNFEIKHKMNSSTFDYVTKFMDSVSDRNDINDNEFKFIIGMDNALMIDTFINWEELIKTIPFIVVNRDTVPPEMSQWFDKSPHEYVNVGSNFSECSSSQIRKEIEMVDGNGLCSGFMSELCNINVFAYILNNELYGVKSWD